MKTDRELSATQRLSHAPELEAHIEDAGRVHGEHVRALPEMSDIRYPDLRARSYSGLVLQGSRLRNGFVPQTDTQSLHLHLGLHSMTLMLQRRKKKSRSWTRVVLILGHISAIPGRCP